MLPVVTSEPTNVEELIVPLTYKLDELTVLA